MGFFRGDEDGDKTKEERKEGEVDGEQEDAVNSVLVTGDFKRRASRDSLATHRNERR